MADNKTKTRISELKRQAVGDMILEEKLSLPSPEVKMLEILRVDTLMSAMNLMEKNPAEYDRNLRNFISAYKGSSALIYGGQTKKSWENILKNIRNDLEISNFKIIAGRIPSLSECEEEIKIVSAQISVYENELKGVKKIKSSASNETDKEAEDILNKMVERFKKKDKSAKISGFIYKSDAVTVKLTSRSGQSMVMVNGALFEKLNNLEGVSRLNDMLVNQSKKNSEKISLKEDNAKIAENRKEIEKKLEAEKKKLEKFEQEALKTAVKYMQNLPAEELFEAFSGQDKELASAFNCDVLKPQLVKSFQEDGRIWNYVQSAKYYDMIKDAVRSGYDKESIVYKAMPEHLKNILKIREIELQGLKNPSKNSVKEMNELLNKYDYRVNLQSIKISNEEKPDEYKRKPAAKIADIILTKANKHEGEAKLSPYGRRSMTLGLMYCLGEREGKNDDAELFKKYMMIYFDQKNFTAAEAITLRKEYGWDEFKKQNIETAKEAYKGIKEIYGWAEFKTENALRAKEVHKELSENAIDAEVLKKGLLDGVWVDAGASSIHHIYPRRLGVLSNNPDEINNQSNLAITVQWKAWQEDNHQLEHFFNMSQYDGVLSYLTKEKGEYARKLDAAGLNEVYYEKPQVKKDGKWVDLIPNDTLLITPNVVVKSPELPDRVKHMAMDCFKPLSIVEEVKERTEELYRERA